MKFDLCGHLQFNVDSIYAHMDAEYLLESSRNKGDNHPDLISCDIDFKEFLTTYQVVTATFDCTIMDVPALVIVWERGNYNGKLGQIESEFQDKKTLYENSEIDSKSREFGMRLAIKDRDFKLSILVREYNGLVCLSSDENGIRDAIGKQAERSPVI